MHAARLRRLVITPVSICVAAAFTAAAATPTAPPFDTYVALGDSAAAVGSLDRIQSGSPRFCDRAADNYPSVVARTLRVREFVDVSCSGAKTANMTAPQVGRGGAVNPPQLDALTPETDLVTLTIGGNDIGVFDVNVITAAQLTVLTERIGAILTEIRRRSPHATVVLTTYLRYLPTSGPCFGVLDHGGGQRLTDTLRELARAHGARFADSYAATGHDICAPVEVRRVNGPRPETPTVPLHANVAGQAYLAAVVVAAALT
ncbi:SGNH/GDSL hydrolase family protein [Nocardia otitidiscaviarum]|uniref:SGNH/GDSL hydrolase family protein n=1 Tax=Nocardia otitidiscaviarum TaxID=1823 RepID=UPI0009DF91C4|nr:SGNH/GDSL hydrolase family protein [Nocardia otitidiscaviarum]MBF6138233.1 SGNH/GDSL hydrolase family protein [Nocardia otitidiscaviarum]MBF6489150.1 SGNH/GDSL hydrolase family protein [Nocardia otitidiscaviarum]